MAFSAWPPRLLLSLSCASRILLAACSMCCCASARLGCSEGSMLERWARTTPPRASEIASSAMMHRFLPFMFSSPWKETGGEGNERFRRADLRGGFALYDRDFGPSAQAPRDKKRAPVFTGALRRFSEYRP